MAQTDHKAFKSKTGVAVSVTKTAARPLLSVSDAELPLFILTPEELRDFAAEIGEEWVRRREQQITETAIPTPRN